MTTPVAWSKPNADHGFAQVLLHFFNIGSLSLRCLRALL
ncbi:hypothetical protein VTO58DRAFT_103932 [Aureobasidium pullulans]